MNQSVEGSTLIVGDGDFSFTVSLTTTWCAPPGVVSSSLDSEESIRKLSDAESNMKILNSRGVKTLLQVDACQLHHHPVLSKKKFMRIIFNFPHIGGKSNHKKNRALINEFFSSAVQLLEPNGQILVTLCKGQGGTPADVPKRAWSDTWQVVSLAANAGLVLTDVVPFDCKHYPGYRSTGFRNQDKGFHVEGALTHVFEQTLLVNIPLKVGDEDLVLSCGCYRCPRYLCEKIQLYRKICDNDHHPLMQSEHRIQLLMKHWLPTIHLGDCYSIVLPHLVFETIGSSTYYIEKIICTDTIQKLCPWQETTDHLHNANPASVGCKSGGIEKAILRTSLLEHLPDLLQTEALHDHLLLLTGQVFQRGMISPNLLPVSKEMLGIVSVSLCSSAQELSEKLTECLRELCIVPLHFKTESDKKEYRHKGIECALVTSIFCSMEDDHVILVSQTWYCSRLDSSKQDLITFSLNLDVLSQIMFNISDKRLLWSVFELEKQLRRKTSLFPMRFVHDISFWGNPDLKFDEVEFCDIIREIAGDSVYRVMLVDRYNEPVSGRESYCYRLEFRSLDQCLSYNTSWQLQSRIRLETTKRLQVSLR